MTEENGPGHRPHAESNRKCEYCEQNTKRDVYYPFHSSST
jgi:hypothetical protein